MTITAKNIGRINVWPTYRVARDADTEESKFTGQLTVWQTNEEARANTSYEEEGGGEGGAPAWVPANAVIHIDLVGGDPQGRAWIAGTGEVAVDTLLGSDPNSEINNGTTSYNPAWLTADGYVHVSYSPAFIGVALPMILDAATIVIRFKQIVDPLDDNVHFKMRSVSTDNGIDCRTRDTEPYVFVSSEGGSLSLELVVALNTGLNAVNVLACTTTATRFDIACNGSEALAGVVDETDRPPGDPLAFVDVNTGALQNYALQSITLYDPLPSTAGLSDLSEVT